MKRLLFIPVALVAIAVSCTGKPDAETPDGNPHPPTVLGLVEFTLEDNGAQIQSSAKWLAVDAKLAAPSLTTNNLPVVSSAGRSSTTDFNNRRYLSATFNVRNPANGRSYDNLTFHAVTVDNTIAGGSSLGGTSLRNLRTSAGTLITDAEIARFVRPTHKLVNISDAMQVDSSGADFQIFHPNTDVQPVQQAINALPSLNGHVEALGYGFVARRAANDPARAIGAGQSGIVTLGLHFPILENAPRTLSLTYVVVNETTTRVTEALEEQGAASGANARSLALGANVGINVFPGSSVSGARVQTACPVVWAVATGGLATSRTECSSPNVGHDNMPYVDRALIPPPTTTFFTTDRVRDTTEMPTSMRDRGEGLFRISCKYSHMNFDDAIVFPGQPGRSHLHTYFGNTEATGNSTAESLVNSGNSTCSGGTINRSAYWIPSVIDTREGRPLVPGDAIFYYKNGHMNPAEIVPIPPGLRIIVGNSRRTTPGEPFTVETPWAWSCDAPDGSEGTRHGHIPANCAAGMHLKLTIGFPQCWDGRNLSSPDQSHMYNGIGNVCPASHPRKLVQISLIVRWVVPSGTTSNTLRLSSDMYPSSQPGGYSTHADWFNGWKPDISNWWTQHCINAFGDCHAHLLGNGREFY